jgi:hypothetical protein
VSLYLDRSSGSYSTSGWATGLQLCVEASIQTPACMRISQTDTAWNRIQHVICRVFRAIPGALRSLVWTGRACSSSKCATARNSRGIYSSLHAVQSRLNSRDNTAAQGTAGIQNCEPCPTFPARQLVKAKVHTQNIHQCFGVSLTLSALWSSLLQSQAITCLFILDASRSMTAALRCG